MAAWDDYMMNSVGEYGGGGVDTGTSITGSSAGYDASSSNGENQGIDSSVANAWWKSLHPDMNGEGMAGGDASGYPNPPAWFTERGLKYPSNDNWVTKGTMGYAPGDIEGGQQDMYGFFDKPDYDPSWTNTLGFTGAPEEFEDWASQNDIGLKMGLGKSMPNAPYYDTLRLQAMKDGKDFGDEHTWAKDESDPFFQAALIAAGSTFGGAMGAMSVGAGGAFTPTWLAGAATGAGAGLGGSLAANGPTMDALKSAGIGAVTGGITAGINPAGALGIEDPRFVKPINNLVNSSVKAGLTGGDIKDAAVGSLTNSGLSAGLGTIFNGVNNMNFGGGDTSLPPVDDYSSGFGDYQAPQFNMGAALGSGYSTPNDPSWMNPPWASALGTDQGMNASYANVQDMSDPYAGMNMGGDLAATQQTARASNPVKQTIMSAMSGLGLGGGNSGGAPGRFDNMAGNLLGLYSAYRNKKQLGGLAGNLRSMYGPNSPYAKQLEQSLLRQDAAAGRRSQVGPRQVELQARLAEMNSRNAPMLAQLYGAQGQNRDRMLSSLMRMGMGGPMGGGLFGKGADWFSNYLNGQSVGTPAGAYEGQDTGYDNGGWIW